LRIPPLSPFSRADLRAFHLCFFPFFLWIHRPFSLDSDDGSRDPGSTVDSPLPPCEAESACPTFFEYAPNCRYSILSPGLKHQPTGAPSKRFPDLAEATVSMRGLFSPGELLLAQVYAFCWERLRFSLFFSVPLTVGAPFLGILRDSQL